MSPNARLKTLARLARSETDAAETELREEMDRVLGVLQTEVDYEVLQQNLEILATIGHRFISDTVKTVGSFIQTIEIRRTASAPSGDPLAAHLARYNTSDRLIAKALDVAVRFRYWDTKAVLSLLLASDKHSADAVRKQVQIGLDQIAKYNLDIFLGEDRKGGLGPAPQLAILETLEAFDQPELKGHLESVLRLLSNLLTTEMQGTSWTYNAMTITRAAVPKLDAIADIRTRSITLLCRLYSLADNVTEKLAVVRALGEGARSGSNGKGDGTRNTLAADAIRVLAFFEKLVAEEDFQVVQKIETTSYWTFVHAPTDDVKQAALKVEDAITSNQEYGIYRLLIGFEGIFGAWTTYERSAFQFETLDKERREKATALARSITDSNYDQWRARILQFAKTESDDLATFPFFYHFLGALTVARPDLALRLLNRDASELSRFLIPILVGLWNGPQRTTVEREIRQWIRSAQENRDHHLFASAKMFLSTDTVDAALLAVILSKARALRDSATVRQVVTVAMARWESLSPNQLLLPALDTLTELKDARWVFDTWYRKEVRTLLAAMTEDELGHVFRNLLLLETIDFHAEELLGVIGDRHPGLVLKFFIDRILQDRQEWSEDILHRYEAIPFDFHMVHEALSKHPALAVCKVLDHFRTDQTSFIYRGGRLLKNIFPTMSDGFESELLKLVRTGDSVSLQFVLGILRNYHGEPSLHSLFKEIVKVVELGSSILDEVAVALETTGVVSGEFGIAEAYERKKQEVADWLSDVDPKVKAFAQRYTGDLERMRDAETKRAEESIALRKHQFGKG